MRSQSLVSGLLLWLLASAALAETRPNVVVLLVDDAGLMDFSAFGGEARMPAIDQLAREGVRFTNYHTSPLCAPSRAMLLTGVDNHRTGVATIPELVRRKDRDQPGYSMHLEPGVLTVADRLKAHGYRTYMTGKWHLGSNPGDLPDAHGFDRSFALDASGADNWEQKPYMPYYAFAPWYEDGKPAELPEDFYSSRFLIDRMIEYIGEGESLNPQKYQQEIRQEVRQEVRQESVQKESQAASGDHRPFFAFIGFQAIHVPVQAPKEFIDKYQGVFDEGWEVLRRARWQRAQSLGLIPPEAPLAPMPGRLRKWEDLNSADKQMFSKSMAVNAGMLEAMDFHIGRLVDFLKRTGEFDNTLFIVTSDNGPAPTDLLHAPGMGFWMSRNGYTHELETLGEKGSMGFIGPEWAHAAAAPGDLFKFYAAEGGIRVPFIISGPGVTRQMPIQSLAMVTDIAPTILDYAGVDRAEQPSANAFRPGNVPIDGRSLRPVLAGSAEYTHSPDTPIGLEVSGNSALFLGHYKITRNTLPYGSGAWRLFDLAIDPGETNDLTATDPQRFSEMRALYDAYAREYGVIELDSEFDVGRQLASNILLKIAWRYDGYLVFIALVMLAILTGLGWWLLRLLRLWRLGRRWRGPGG